MTSPPRGGDSGAVGTIFAILLAFGVVLGFLALSVDVGNLMWERRQVQNGADAAVLALADACGAKASTCSDSVAGALVGDLANRNAADGHSSVDSVCGRFKAGTAPAGWTSVCAAPTGTNLGTCLPLPADLASGNINYVEVVTGTATGSSSAASALPGWISKAVTGSSTTAHVPACARAAYGPPAGGAASLPITLSACEWQRNTGGLDGGGGGSYIPAPVYNGSNAYGYGGAGQPAWPAAALPPPAAGLDRETILMIQNNSSSSPPPSTCPTWQGHALPGGFGILETTSASACTLKEYPFQWMHTSTGQNTACDLSLLVGKVVSVPIFACTSDYLPGQPAPDVAPALTCTTGNGNNAWYWRLGYAKFYLSGYNVTVTGSAPNKMKSLVSGTFPCTGGNSCVSGWFLNGALDATAIDPNAGDFGTYTVIPGG